MGVFRTENGHSSHLMYVKVDDENLLHSLPAQELFAGDGQVVHDAEAVAEAGECVVRAACGVAGQAMLQCKLGCQQRTCAITRPAGILGWWWWLGWWLGWWLQ